MIAEGLKGNRSVTEVDLVSAGLLLARLLLLTSVEQKDNHLHISDAVIGEVVAITERNENDPEQRLAEVTAIKQVF